MMSRVFKAVPKNGRMNALPYCVEHLLEEVERDYMLRVFRETGGVISILASRLGVRR
jgi:hypothetical protein